MGDGVVALVIAVVSLGACEGATFATPYVVLSDVPCREE